VALLTVIGSTQFLVRVVVLVLVILQLGIEDLIVVVIVGLGHAEKVLLDLATSYDILTREPQL
jgi:hypothetical protein